MEQMRDLQMSELLKLAIEQKRIPRYLYKYTTIENAIKALENGTVYFAQFSEFNDEYEGFAKLDTNISINDWLSFFVQNGIFGWNAWLLANTVINDPRGASKIVKTVIEESQKKNGFLCLSTRPNSILMWAHYTNQNKGCCLEYDLLADTQLFNHIKKIDYDDNTIVYNYLRNQGGALEAMFHKSKQWEYEDEYRVIWINNHGVRKVNDSCLTRVIVGPQFQQNSDENKTKLKDLTPVNKLYKAVKGDNPKVFDIKPF